MRVLIVEDEPEMADLLRRALVEEGYAVDVARTGDDGFQYAITVDYQVIVLDVLLPVCSGFDVCARPRRVGVGTVAHFQHTVDAAIDDMLADRARDLAPPGADGRLTEDADTAAQLLSADGQVRAASPRAGAAPLLAPAQVAAARRHALWIDRKHVPGLPGRARLLATTASDGSNGAVVVAAGRAGRDSAVADLRTELSLAFPIVLLIAAGAAYLLATAALRPVERMRARAEAITSDTPGQRRPVPAGRDEITRLGATLNDMLDRLHTAPARERDFVSDASHELRTPLGLGLAIVAASARRHAGTAHAANHPDGGAEVSLHLPTAIAIASALPAGSIEDSPLPTSGAAPTGRSAPPEKDPS